MLRGLSDDAGFLQRGVCAILRDGLQRAGGELHGHKFLHLRHPYALGLQVRLEVALRDRGDVLTDATFLFRETATVNFAALQPTSVFVTHTAAR